MNVNLRDLATKPTTFNKIEQFLFADLPPWAEIPTIPRRIKALNIPSRPKKAKAIFHRYDVLWNSSQHNLT